MLLPIFPPEQKTCFFLPLEVHVALDLSPENFLALSVRSDSSEIIELDPP